MKQKKYKLIKIFIICGILLFVVYIFNYIKENSRKFTIKPSSEFSNIIKDIKKEHSYVESIHMTGNSPNVIHIYIYTNEDKKKEDIAIKEIHDKILYYTKSNDFIEYLKNTKKIFYKPDKYFSLSIHFEYKKYLSTKFICAYYYYSSNDEEIWKPEN